MRANARRPGANRNRRHGRKLDEVDCRDGAVSGVANVREEMQPRAKERRPQLHRQFARPNHREHREQEDETVVEA